MWPSANADSLWKGFSVVGLPRPATPEVERYLEEIRDVMVTELDVAKSEAEGRIRSALGSWDLESGETQNILGHEDPQYWARWIYYGPDVQWWLEDSQALEPRPWP